MKKLLLLLLVTSTLTGCIPKKTEPSTLEEPAPTFDEDMEYEEEYEGLVEYLGPVKEDVIDN